MRLTRPGARPCHALGRSRLSSTELRGLVLCPCFDDECAGSVLRSSQVFELVPSAIRWVVLDVKVMVVRDPASRRLVHRHHVRKRTVQAPAVLLYESFHNYRERLIVTPSQ